MTLNLSGLVGVFILLATLAVVGFITLILFLFVLYEHFATNKEERSSGFPWNKYFLLSGILLLIFDGMFLMFLATRNDKTMTNKDGEVFDERMLFIWIPSHIAVYFLFPFFIKIINSKKTEINEFLDKYR
jgi:hypothetical protein